jgi:hypothetical protein
MTVRACERPSAPCCRACSRRHAHGSREPRSRARCRRLYSDRQRQHGTSAPNPRARQARDRPAFLAGGHQEQRGEPLGQRNFAALEYGFDCDRELLAAFVAMIQAGAMRTSLELSHMLRGNAARRNPGFIRPQRSRMSLRACGLQPSGIQKRVGTARTGFCRRGKFEQRAFGPPTNKPLTTTSST